MSLELRVLSGARAGARERFEKSIVAIGRHPMSDMKFDPNADLDVSTRHAELRGVNGVWTVYDHASTNGTFVNGERVEREHRLASGDVVSFGANGPRVEVIVEDEPAAGVAPATVLRPETPRSAPVVPAAVPRRDTTLRVAEAVAAQTKTMRRAMGALAGLVLVGGGAAFFFWQRQSAERDREHVAQISHYESLMVGFQKNISAVRLRDSALAALLEQSAAVSQRELRSDRAAGGRARAGSVDLLSQRMARTAAVAQMDVARVHDLNDAAIAMLASDLDGTVVAGTSFGIAPSGLLVTNKHVVRTSGGQLPKRIAVIFANTRAWIPAHVVRVSDGDDLALIQIDVPGVYPVVAGVSRAGAQARVGAPVASIGYPLAVDTPMEGSGLRVTARSTTAVGTVSKRLDDVLQIDSYAGHGSSGSPVFDSAGNVVGVIYGGAPESNGRIVYAVPAQRLAAFLGAERSGILK